MYPCDHNLHQQLHGRQRGREREGERERWGHVSCLIMKRKTGRYRSRRRVTPKPQHIIRPRGGARERERWGDVGVRERKMKTETKRNSK